MNERDQQGRAGLLVDSIADDLAISIDGAGIDLAGRVDMSEPIPFGREARRQPTCDRCDGDAYSFMGDGRSLCAHHTFAALIDAEDGNRQRDAVIAEMTRTIAGLQGEAN